MLKETVQAGLKPHPCPFPCFLQNLNLVSWYGKLWDPDSGRQWSICQSGRKVSVSSLPFANLLPYLYSRPPTSCHPMLSPSPPPISLQRQNVNLSVLQASSSRMSHFSFGDGTDKEPCHAWSQGRRGSKNGSDSNCVLKLGF